MFTKDTTTTKTTWKWSRS